MDETISIQATTKQMKSDLIFIISSLFELAAVVFTYLVSFL